MARDPAALKTHLEGARYTDALAAGNHGEVRRLVNALEDGQKVFQALPRADVIDALAIGVPHLTNAQRDTLRTLLPERGAVDFTKVNVRTTLQALFPAASPEPDIVAARDNLIAILQRPARYGHRAGFDDVTLGDIRKAARQIVGSAAHTYQNDAVAEAARQARAVIINRVGAKIRQLREKMVPAGRGQEFVDFRQSIYATTGVDQADTDAQREAVVDAKLVTEGL